MLQGGGLLDQLKIDRRTRFAVWKHSPEPLSYEQQLKYESMTLHFLRLRSKAMPPHLVDHSLSRILNEADHSGAEKCCVLRPGTILKDGFMEQALSFCEEFESGAVLYKGPDENILFFDLKKWRELGSPRFNEFFGAAKTLPESVLSRQEFPPAQYFESECGGAHSKVFPFNTESYIDVRRRSGKQKLDGLITVAAGLKDLYILNSHGIHEDASLIYFDIAPEALALKERLYSQWNGQNYPEFVREAMKAQSNAKFSCSLNEVEDCWRQELTQWKSQEELSDIFSIAKNLKREFVLVDVLKDADVLLRQIQNLKPGQYALWLSNCFNYTPTLAKANWNLSQMETLGLKFMSDLLSGCSARGIQIEMYGEDVVHGSKSEFTQTKLHEVFS